MARAEIVLVSEICPSVEYCKWQEQSLNYIIAGNKVDFRQSKTEITLLHAQGTTKQDFLCLIFSLAALQKSCLI
jgi:hypothetical protein